MFNLLDPITYRKEALTDDLLEMRTRAANRQYDSNMSRRHTIGQGDPDAPVDPNEWQWHSLRGRLDKLAIPMIYLHGLDDMSAPVENSMLCEPLLPNIQFFYPKACGHQGQTDQPDLFNQVFLEFFRDGKVSRKTADAANISKNRPELASVVEQAGVAAPA
jgi:pimeloyl-ACP methyl ester carboxylesterase